MKTQASKARGARRSRRGAAMVEAVVAIPFFIVIFVALAFVGKLYTEKQRTLSLSRQQAWVHAMGNCEGNMPDVSSKDAGAIPQQDGMEFGETEKYGGFSGGDTASKGSRMAVSTFKGKVNAQTQEKNSNGQTSTVLKFEQKVQTTTWVTCNEPRVKGDLLGALKTAWSVLTKW